MLVLCTTVAHDSFGGRLDRPGIEWLRMDTDGSLLDGAGTVVPWPEARPEVAWGTSDLFRAGAPVAAFFRFLVDCPSLRWFQSPAAGYDSEPFRRMVEHGVRVCNAHVNSLPIAEFVLRAVLDEFQGQPNGGARRPPSSGASMTGGRCRAPRGWSSASDTSAAPWPCGPGPSGPR